MARAYRFEIQGQSFRFDPQGVEVELEGTDEAVHLTPKERDILAYHLVSFGKFVSDEELLAAIWSGKDVYPSLPGKHTRSLRKKMADAIGLAGSDRERLFERSGKLGYKFKPDSFEATDDQEEKIVQAAERSALDVHRAELVVFTPDINDFISVLGEFREITEILAGNPSSVSAASMLIQTIEDFKGYRVDSTDDLLVEMQKYLGYYMNVVSLLLDALHMLANERIYGFNTKEDSRPFKDHRTFDSDSDFEVYLSAEVGSGAVLLKSTIRFMKESFHERPDLLLLKEQYKGHIKSMLQWSRQIAKDSRGDEMLFERI